MQPTTPQYCFPCSDGLEFPREQVLNHHLAENGKLTRRPMHGLLLAIGGRMPDTLRHGSLLEAGLILRDVEAMHTDIRLAFGFTAERSRPNRRVRT